MKLCCLSDLHGQYKKDMSWYFNQADVVVIAGDFSEVYFNRYGGQDWGKSVSRFEKNTLDFLRSINKPIVIVAGNHDMLLDVGKWPNSSFMVSLIKEIPDLHYLERSSVEIGGKVFWGNPWTPFFCNWAFNYETYGPIAEEQARRGFATCPENVNVIVSHGPPKGILDITDKGQNVGEPYFAKVLEEKRFPNLQACVFGHIHNARGVTLVDGVMHMNVCICDENYETTGVPVLLDI